MQIKEGPDGLLSFLEKLLPGIMHQIGSDFLFHPSTPVHIIRNKIDKCEEESHKENLLGCQPNIHIRDKHLHQQRIEIKHKPPSIP